MKILLLEDDLILNEIIKEHLLEKENEVVSVFDGIQAEDILYSQTFDLLLLDVNVPNINGFKLLEDLRSKDIFTPAIFLTSLDQIDDIEKGFNAGCDDYIKKPFVLKELDLRIQNMKRLFNINSNEKIQISKNIILDIKNLTITLDNKNIRIAYKEAKVLQYLVNNKTKPISVEELSINIWSYDDAPLASTIRTYIKNIRKILGDDSISNTRGVGYRFNAE